MTALLAALSPITRALARTALILAGLGLVAMTIAVGWLVVGRYVFNETPTWTEPAVLMLMSWFILLGAAVGVRERDHLGFEIALHYAPGPLKFAMRLVTEVLVIGFGVAMVVYGWQLAAINWRAMTPMLPVPQGAAFVPMIVGGGLIALFSLEKLFELFAGRADPEPAISTTTTGGA